jgi:Uma2 family endonuclease
VTGRRIAVEEYLHTSFDNPDPEYRDGELVERSPADTAHGSAHASVGAFFVLRCRGLHLFPCSSVRLKVREELYLVPDISVFWPDEPVLAFPDRPPLIVIEILSDGDRLTAVRSKLGEYRAWGVPHVWLVDPYLRKLYACDAGLTEVATLRVPELDLELRPEHIFE